MFGINEEKQGSKYTPDIGSIVWYKLTATDLLIGLANNGELEGHNLPALVTRSSDDGVLDLQVFGNSQGIIVWKQNIREGTIGGTWEAPEE